MGRRKGHGSLGTSGVNTPFLTEASSTPSSETAVNPHELTAQNIDSLTEKLQRRKSFTKAVLVEAPPPRTQSSDGPTKEHIEQGRVKTDVYVQYIEAASKTGFVLFVLSMVLSQVVNVADPAAQTRTVPPADRHMLVHVL